MPKYRFADKAVEEMGRKLIAECDELRHIDGHFLRYVMVSEWKGQKEFLLGEVKAFTGIGALLLHKALDYSDPSDPADYKTYIVYLHERFWEAMKEDEQRMLLFHYLCSLQASGGDGETLTVGKPDYSLYRDEVARFGCSIPTIKTLLNIIDGAEQPRLELDESDESEGEYAADAPFSGVPSSVLEVALVRAEADFEPDSDEEHAALMERRRKIEYGADDADIEAARKSEQGVSE